jgi:hypothetical protein
MTTLTSNQFKSTTINGTFNNIDYGTTLANATFQRDITVGTGIKVVIAGVTYTLTAQQIEWLTSLTSDLQTQLNMIDTSGVGLLIKKTGGSTAFTIDSTTGQVDILGNGVLNIWNSLGYYFQIFCSGTDVTINSNYGVVNITPSILFNGGLTIPTGQNITLNGSLIANGTTISPTILSYLSGCTSNIQSQLSTINTSSLLGLNNTWTGTNSMQALSCTSITCSGSETISGSLNVNGVIIKNNGLGLTLLGDGTSSRFDMSASTTTDLPDIRFEVNTTGTVYQGSLSLYCGVLSLNGALYLNAGLTIPTAQILNLIGSLYVNSTTITPTILSYLSGASSNIQSQISAINTSALLSLANTWTNTNTFTDGITIKSGSTTAVTVSSTTGQVEIFGNGVLNIWNTIGYYFQINCSSTNVTFNSNYGSINFNPPVNCNSTLSASGLITANAGLTIPSGQSFNMNGSLIANSTTITPTVLSYLSGATSNIQSQISAINTSALLSLNNTWTGTNNMQALSCTSITCSGSETISGSLNVNGVIIKNNGLGLTLLGDGSSSRFDMSASTTIDLPDVRIEVNSTGTAYQGSLSIYCSNLSLSGNINSITPTQLSYLSGATSNIQSQISAINTSALLSLANYWTNTNNFKNVNMSGNLIVSDPTGTGHFFEISPSSSGIDLISSYGVPITFSATTISTNDIEATSLTTSGNAMIGNGLVVKSSGATTILNVTSTGATITGNLSVSGTISASNISNTVLDLTLSTTTTYNMSTYPTFVFVACTDSSSIGNICLPSSPSEGYILTIHKTISSTFLYIYTSGGAYNLYCFGDSTNTTGRNASVVLVNTSLYQTQFLYHNSQWHEIQRF